MWRLERGKEGRFGEMRHHKVRENHFVLVLFFCWAVAPRTSCFWLFFWCFASGTIFIFWRLSGSFAVFLEISSRKCSAPKGKLTGNNRVSEADQSSQTASEEVLKLLKPFKKKERNTFLRGGTGCLGKNLTRRICSEGGSSLLILLYFFTISACDAFSSLFCPYGICIYGLSLLSQVHSTYTSA